MADLLGIGTSALLANSRALATTSNNIANVNTDGYSRQRVGFNERPPEISGIGNGVSVGSVSRVYDGFAVEQVRINNASFSNFETLNEFSSQLDSILADSNAGLSPAISEFFDALQEVAGDPSSTVTRQVLLSESESLVSRFDAISGRLESLNNAVNSDITATVNDVNVLSRSIADLNGQITDTEAGSGGVVANGLRDQRDRLLLQLSEYTNVSTVEQNGGALNVFIGNGQSLVSGSFVQTLSVTTNEFDSSRLEIGYVTSGATAQISDQIAGGRLGGLLDFRASVLEPSRNTLGQVAIGITSQINDQHRLGQNLDGTAGGLYFNDLAASSPLALQNTNNTGTGVIDVAVTDVNLLTNSDYSLRNNAGVYSVTRLSDNTVTNLPPSFPVTAAVVDGLTISVASGTVNSGDAFLIRPTAAAPRDLRLQISDVRQIAAATPIIGQASSNNTGNARISSGVVNAPPPPNANLTQSVTITFTTPTTFNVTGTGTGNPTNVAYTSGGAITYNGFTVEVSGVPTAGDIFTVSANTGGVGDNRNALVLANIQQQLGLNNGTSSISSVYGSLVAEVGTRTRESELNREAQQTLLAQSQARRDSISGVNLDEETTDLLRFQQSFQAAAQIISIADDLFQVLLGAVSR
ncbi:MAG: flagellar hook-associated protein FlgK [Gammaproteobacteria bacterium]|nr:flagellar hook-associated protein FlgK [Gammaproteobacteria bacterium]